MWTPSDVPSAGTSTTSSPPLAPPTCCGSPPSSAAQIAATPEPASEALKCTVNDARCQPAGASHVVTGGVTSAAACAAATPGAGDAGRSR